MFFCCEIFEAPDNSPRFDRNTIQKKPETNHIQIYTVHCEIRLFYRFQESKLYIFVHIWIFRFAEYSVMCELVIRLGIGWGVGDWGSIDQLLAFAANSYGPVQSMVIWLSCFVCYIEHTPHEFSRGMYIYGHRLSTEKWSWPEIEIAQRFVRGFECNWQFIDRLFATQSSTQTQHRKQIERMWGKVRWFCLRVTIFIANISRIFVGVIFDFMCDRNWIVVD